MGLYIAASGVEYIINSRNHSGCLQHSKSHDVSRARGYDNAHGTSVPSPWQTSTSYCLLFFYCTEVHMYHAKLDSASWSSIILSHYPCSSKPQKITWCVLVVPNLPNKSAEIYVHYLCCCISCSSSDSFYLLSDLLRANHASANSTFESAIVTGH
ncbi:uncharacterized protein LY89DRAFT_21759 [Mollisia scopiformis]|uniref:Uncharacterized protein n=1 Tax=Mollisia scopiformis TaxID=149040 RepID=A0A194XWJ0_MOLSC|nr:uncharacterized protein LY89DRAFT_21759 [Mollisia scopiformis]KUJ24389.1 hypothetical protein LY89DRAFT_21759 [Mollisia scopiformis]